MTFNFTLATVYLFTQWPHSERRIVDIAGNSFPVAIKVCSAIELFTVVVLRVARRIVVLCNVADVLQQYGLNVDPCCYFLLFPYLLLILFLHCQHWSDELPIQAAITGDVPVLE